MKFIFSFLALLFCIFKIDGVFAIEILENKTAFDNFLKTSKLAVVEFSATYCEACKYLEPQLENLAKSHGKIKFAKIDVPSNQQLANEQGANSMPTVICYTNGKKWHTHVGADIVPLQQKVEMMNKIA
nr:thioredoxin [Hydra vulgaris]